MPFIYLFKAPGMNVKQENEQKKGGKGKGERAKVDEAGVSGDLTLRKRMVWRWWGRWSSLKIRSEERETFFFLS